VGISAKKSLESQERDRLEAGFIDYYLNQTPITKAMSNAGVPTSTYYRWRDAFEDEVEEVQGVAADRAAAIMRRRHSEFLLSQVGASVEVQRQARDAVFEGVPMLAAIARGEVRQVGDKNVIPYPRDIARAMELLLQVATFGVLPEESAILLQEEEASKPPPQFPGLAFSKVTATTPSGDTVTFKKGDTFDGEIIDEPSPD